MCISKVIKILSVPFLLALFLSPAVLFAQTVTVPAADKSSERSAGFSFTKNSVNTKADVLVEPVIHYQQNIHMLSSVDDRPSFQVFGDGRVIVHFPVYMKKAGDYEMQLDEGELINLIRTLSSNGVLDFDEKKIREKRKADKKALKAKGQFFAISDTVETIVEIRLDEYQRNKSEKKISNFYKKFNWDNLEQDAIRYKNTKELTRANQSISDMQNLMKDARLVKMAKKR